MCIIFLPLLKQRFRDLCNFGFFPLIQHLRYGCLEYQFSSITHVQLFVTPWSACSMPGLPVHYQLPEFTQTHVHRVGDAIQPSHPLSSPSPPAFNLSQHQGLFK